MTTRRVLDDAQLAELLRLTKVADTVELKLTVPDTEIRSVGELLGIDPLDAQIRQVIFFDTPDLSLQAAGLVVRARRIQGGAGDTVVKLRPVTPEIVGRLSGASVEVDAMPGGFVCSASVKGKSTADEVRRVVRRKAKVGDLLSKTQKEFYRQHAPEGLRLSDLSILGPINIFKLKFEPRGPGTRDGRRALALPERDTGLGAIHQVPAGRHLSGCGRDEVLPDREGCRCHRRAADQDQDGAHPLRQGAHCQRSGAGSCLTEDVP